MLAKWRNMGFPTMPEKNVEKPGKYGLGCLRRRGSGYESTSVYSWMEDYDMVANVTRWKQVRVSQQRSDVGHPDGKAPGSEGRCDNQLFEDDEAADERNGVAFRPCGTRAPNDRQGGRVGCQRRQQNGC